MRLEIVVFWWLCLCPTSEVICDIFFRDFYDHSFRDLAWCSIWWKGNRLFVFPVLSHSHDNRETLKVVVQGFLADAGAESEACLKSSNLWGYPDYVAVDPEKQGETLLVNCRDPWGWKAAAWMKTGLGAWWHPCLKQQEPFTPGHYLALLLR